MKIESLLVVAILVAPVLSRAASPNALAALNKSIIEITTALDRSEQCSERVTEFKADLAKKKAAIAAEFKGATPVAFNDLLWQKTTRITKQHALCVKYSEELARMTEALDLTYRSFEPKTAALKQQMATLDARKKKMRLSQSTAKPQSKTPTPNSEPQ